MLLFLKNAESIDMLAVYFECSRNATIADREYAIRYPGRRPTPENYFGKLQ